MLWLCPLPTEGYACIVLERSSHFQTERDSWLSVRVCVDRPTRSKKKRKVIPQRSFRCFPRYWCDRRKRRVNKRQSLGKGCKGLFVGECPAPGGGDVLRDLLASAGDPEAQCVPLPVDVCFWVCFLTFVTPKKIYGDRKSWWDD